MDKTGLKVTAKVKLKKYAEGVKPEDGAPFETVEKEVVFMGEEARKLLEQMGGAQDVTN